MTEQEQGSPGVSRNAPDLSWERQMIERVLLATIREQRRTRRWNIFFRVVMLVYVVWFLIVLSPTGPTQIAGHGPHTAVVDVRGEISADSQASAENIIRGLHKAVENKHVRGIILRMNTPGGTPVQAGYVYDEIHRLKAERPELPIYAVVGDLCASGGYYIAAAADKIYVSPASIVGSIGVIMNGFGLVEAIDKLGIERRLFTAGENKALLDPFVPVPAEQKTYVQELLNQIHAQFIQAVKTGRGNRLSDDPRLFTGLVWTGADSIRLGLADDIGSAGEVAKNVIGAKEMVNYTPKEGLLERLSQEVGTHAGEALRSLWLGVAHSVMLR